MASAATPPAAPRARRAAARDPARPRNAEPRARRPTHRPRRATVKVPAARPNATPAISTATATRATVRDGDRPLELRRLRGSLQRGPGHGGGLLGKQRGMHVRRVQPRGTLELWRRHAGSAGRRARERGRGTRDAASPESARRRRSCLMRAPPCAPLGSSWRERIEGGPEFVVSVKTGYGENLRSSHNGTHEPSLSTRRSRLFIRLRSGGSPAWRRSPRTRRRWHRRRRS